MDKSKSYISLYSVSSNSNCPDRLSIRISFYRMARIQRSRCSALVEDIASIYGNYGYDSQIIVAAVRSGKTIVDAALVGADIVTAGFQIFKGKF